MPIIVPIAGEKKMLDKYLAIDTLRVQLFQTNITPSSTTVLATFTAGGVEANYSGYTSQSIFIADWTAAADDGTGRAFSTNILKIFINTTGVVGNNIYGYWITDPGGALLWCERFGSAPIDMLTAGKSFYWLPILTFKSEF